MNRASKLLQCDLARLKNCLRVNEADNLTDEACQAGEISHGDDGNFVVKVVSLIAGIGHPKVGQVKIFQGDQH